MVACFRYASIDVHSVYLPPPKLEFNYEIQEWIQREKDEVELLDCFLYFFSYIGGYQPWNLLRNSVLSNRWLQGPSFCSPKCLMLCINW